VPYTTCETHANSQLPCPTFKVTLRLCAKRSRNWPLVRVPWCSGAPAPVLWSCRRFRMLGGACKCVDMSTGGTVLGCFWQVLALVQCTEVVLVSCLGCPCHILQWMWHVMTSRGTSTWGCRRSTRATSTWGCRWSTKTRDFPLPVWRFNDDPLYSACSALMAPHPPPGRQLSRGRNNVLWFLCQLGLYCPTRDPVQSAT